MYDDNNDEQLKPIPRVYCLSCEYFDDDEHNDMCYLNPEDCPFYDESFDS